MELGGRLELQKTLFQVEAFACQVLSFSVCLRRVLVSAGGVQLRPSRSWEVPGGPRGSQNCSRVASSRGGLRAIRGAPCSGGGQNGSRVALFRGGLRAILGAFVFWWLSGLLAGRLVQGRLPSNSGCLLFWWLLELLASRLVKGRLASNSGRVAWS